MKAGSIVTTSIGLCVVLIAGLMAGCPRYNVWQQGLKGQAELRRAQQNRQITVEEAMAANEAATSKAEAQIKIATASATAEVERAKGVAEAKQDYRRKPDRKRSLLALPVDSGITGRIKRSDLHSDRRKSGRFLKQECGNNHRGWLGHVLSYPNMVITKNGN